MDGIIEDVVLLGTLEGETEGLSVGAEDAVVGLLVGILDVGDGEGD
jgi:hypothetical protein